MLVSRILRILLWAYGIAGVFSLLVIPVGAKGWFGLPPDPLVAVIAILLAMPWSLLVLGMLPADSPFLAGGVLIVSMAFNLCLGIWLLRWWNRRTARRSQGAASAN